MHASHASTQCFAALAVTLTTLAPRAWASPPAVASDTITVRIYDYASAEPELLSRASEVAAAILADAGVPTRWEQCRIREDELRLSPSCSKRAGAAVLQLRIQTELQAKRIALRAWQFGYAVPTERGFGVIAGVFVRKARDLARSQGLDLPIVLGHVMAHELGHLLLGSGRHGEKGIMRPRWNDRDLRRAQTGLLGFTSAQAMRMRALAAARTLESREAQGLYAGADRRTLVGSAEF
jgi:hypothetical protein